MSTTAATSEYGKIVIDGEKLVIEEITDGGYLPMIRTSDGCEYYVAEDSEAAGKAAAKYWEDMANDDPREFACIIGEERLVQWGMGRSDGWGFSCLQDFLEGVAGVPEEEWARYDGQERAVEERGRGDVYVTEAAEAELGFQPTVAYRHN